MFVFLAALISVIDLLPSSLTNWMPDWLSIILAIGFFIGSLALGITVLTKTVLPPWLPTWMYCNLGLRVKISPREADLISFLFEGSLPGGRWYPLTPLRDLHEDVRKLALFKIANNVAREHRFRAPFSWLDELDQENPKSRSSEQPGSTKETGPPRSIQSALSILELLHGEVTPASLRSAYHSKITRFHPDKYSNSTASERAQAEEMSKLINGAYAELNRFYFGNA
jgi:hypothetical protein